MKGLAVLYFLVNVIATVFGLEMVNPREEFQEIMLSITACGIFWPFSLGCALGHC